MVHVKQKTSNELNSKHQASCNAIMIYFGQSDGKGKVEKVLCCLDVKRNSFIFVCYSDGGEKFVQALERNQGFVHNRIHILSIHNLRVHLVVKWSALNMNKFKFTDRSLEEFSLRNESFYVFKQTWDGFPRKSNEYSRCAQCVIPQHKLN